MNIHNSANITITINCLNWDRIYSQTAKWNTISDFTGRLHNSNYTRTRQTSLSCCLLVLSLDDERLARSNHVFCLSLRLSCEIPARTCQNCSAWKTTRDDELIAGLRRCVTRINSLLVVVVPADVSHPDEATVSRWLHSAAVRAGWQQTVRPRRLDPETRGNHLASIIYAWTNRVTVLTVLSWKREERRKWWNVTFYGLRRLLTVHLGFFFTFYMKI